MAPFNRGRGIFKDQTNAPPMGKGFAEALLSALLRALLGATTLAQVLLPVPMWPLIVAPSTAERAPD